MSELTWSWLCVPYLACAVTMLAVAILGSLVRGDQVMRLGVVGAATTTLPWTLCSAVAACTQDPDAATRVLRLGFGPVALLGPNLLIVLLGAAGQLERHRWFARIATAVGVILLGLCWTTSWVVPGVQRLPSGLLYITAGPLTDLHMSQLALWLALGMLIVRRSSTPGEKRRQVRMLLGVFVLAMIGSIDVLTVHRIWGSYPIAWLPGVVAGVIALYLVRFTDLLRPQGYDRAVITEAAAFAASIVVIGVLAWILDDAEPLTFVLVASVVWSGMLAASWALVEQRPVRVASERALEQFVSRLTDVEDERVVVKRLAELWIGIGVEARSLWRTEGDQLVDVVGGETWSLDRKVAAWLVERGQAIAPNDLATIKLGALRPALEALVTAHKRTLLVPLIDRDVLVGLVEADHGDALREDERGLVMESSRAVARAVTYAALAREAAKEGATAREVEVAEAMRLKASASRDDELGRWSVAAEYRTAPRTTGAGWSATLLPDGRLALMVTEAASSGAESHGVAAALATAALTGAFAAATTGSGTVELDDLLTSLQLGTEGVMRGGEPIAAFLAVLDAERHVVAWACAGHPGAHLVGPVAYDLSQFPDGSLTAARPRTVVLATRGEIAMPSDSLLVIASGALRGEDDQRWQAALRDQAPAGPRLATVLVDAALRQGDQRADFLAVVVRQRPQ